MLFEYRGSTGGRLERVYKLFSRGGAAKANTKSKHNILSDLLRERSRQNLCLNQKSRGPGACPGTDTLRKAIPSPAILARALRRSLLRVEPGRPSDGLLQLEGRLSRSARSEDGASNVVGKWPPRLIRPGRLPADCQMRTAQNSWQRLGWLRHFPNWRKRNESNDADGQLTGTN